MDYLFSVIFLLLNFYSYQFGMNSIVFLLLSAALFFGMYYFSFKRTGSFLVASMIVMCHTWQASWTDVFGVNYAMKVNGMQITWFYITGACILLYFILNIKDVVSKPLPPVPLGMFFAWIVIMLYPLFISPSITEGLKELLVTGFFFVLAFIAFMFSGKASAECREYVVDAYIFNMTVTSAFLILQFVVYKASGVLLFASRIGSYFGGTVFNAYLLMGDTSSSTIFIAAAMFFVLERLNKNNWLKYVSIALILMVGLAATTRRTSIVTLCPFLIMYSFLHFKEVSKKVVLAVLSVVLIAVMLYYLSMTRSITNIDALLYDNGRFSGYRESLEILKNNIFGVGYDNVNLLNMMSQCVVHNTFLRWLNMGGIPYFIVTISLVVYFVVVSYKRTIKTEFWFLLYAFVASNLIPDLMAARIAVLPVMMVFIISDKGETVSEESSAVQSRDMLQSRV